MTGTLNGNNINCSGTISGANIVGANTNWDAAYSHSIDNSQAHSDYMLNTGDTASGDYNFDSNTLFVNSVNHKVGIGTVSPSERIHVYHATENVLARIESGDTDVWLAFEDSNTASANNVLVGAIGDSLVLRGGGTNTLYIDGSSNVGIGTASPGSALEVASGDVNITTGKLIQNTTTISATGPTDNFDVSGANILFVDNSSNAVTIGGFVGGVSGQVLQVVAINNNNNITLEYNEGTGNQDILLLSGADETLATRFGGWTLVCDGSSWYSVRFA